MKHLSLTLWSLVIMLSVCFVGCDYKADVDLSNVDMTASVQTKLSLPLGSFSAKFGDFLGANSVEQLTIDEQGRYVFMDTVSFSRSYHPIDLAEFVASTHSEWHMGTAIEQLKEKIIEMYPALGMIGNIPLPINLPAGMKFDLEFPIDIDLKKMNIDYNHRRVDSVIVDLARFTSTYSLENIDMPWSDIKGIQIILNEHFRRAGGDTLHLPIENSAFGTPMPIEVDNFHLILMEDMAAEPGADNIVDSLSIKVRFQIETSQVLQLDTNQRIGYDFGLEFVDYSAMFGYFAASNLMRDDLQNKPIHELWSGWSMFDGWVLPVSEPTVDLIVDHTVAVPMIVHLSNLSTQSKTGEVCYATFDENKTVREKTMKMDMQIAMDDPLEKRSYNTIHLDYTPENGNIDTLMTISPYSVSYNFDVSPDSTAGIKQYRITDNTDINLSAILRIPFAFNDSVHVAFTDTLKDVDLSQLQLDSLLEEVALIKEVEEACLHLYLVVDNSIPFAISGNFTFYDANDEVVQLSEMTKTSVDVKIDYPDSIAAGVVTEPSINHMPLIKIKKEDFGTLASIKKIILTAQLGDNRGAVALTPNAAVRITMGVTADIDAILDLGQLFIGEETIN